MWNDMLPQWTAITMPKGLVTEACISPFQMAAPVPRRRKTGGFTTWKTRSTRSTLASNKPLGAKHRCALPLPGHPSQRGRLCVIPQIFHISWIWYALKSILSQNHLQTSYHHLECCQNFHHVFSQLNLLPCLIKLDLNSDSPWGLLTHIRLT